jgi:hypothetical protein
MRLLRTARADRWMLAAGLPSALLAAGALAACGTAAPGTILGLKMTARWAYCFFWPAYTGGALLWFWGPRFGPFAARARELGLAFVAAMVPHTALVVWILYILPKLVFFAIALALAYVLALLSVRRVAARFDAPVVRQIRTLAVEYIALAFLRDFLRFSFHGGVLEALAYLPFTALALGAAILRLSYWLSRRSKAIS